ncbi:MAG: hypothetical protein EKK39_14785 [Sphingobacteriales bacterium]|nr:MAG: hypothetical protein EKK39_14785 [Sphingobacteriales bacterium]
MKLKLTNAELITLIDLIDINIDDYKHVDENDFEAKLYRCIFEEIKLKLYQISILKKPNYSVKLKPHWMLAFYNDFKNNTDNISFAGNLINQLCNKIHQTLLTI